MADPSEATLPFRISMVDLSRNSEFDSKLGLKRRAHSLGMIKTKGELRESQSSSQDLTKLKVLVLCGN